MMVRGWWEIMYKDIVGAAKIVTQPGQSLGMTSMVSHLALFSPGFRILVADAPLLTTLGGIFVFRSL